MTRTINGIISFVVIQIVFWLACDWLIDLELKIKAYTEFGQTMIYTVQHILFVIIGLYATVKWVEE